MFGDIDSLVWLAIKSTPSEAKEYFDMINAMKVSNIIVIPLKMYVVIHNFIPWIRGELKGADAKYISDCVDLVKLYVPIVLLFATLVTLIIARAKLMLE